tara:strand:- start:467 stop:748 length:282 start_codon:yes stop_codon:yes gene_type:complete
MTDEMKNDRPENVVVLELKEFTVEAVNGSPTVRVKAWCPVDKKFQRTVDAQDWIRKSQKQGSVFWALIDRGIRRVGVEIVERNVLEDVNLEEI